VVLIPFDSRAELVKASEAQLPNRRPAELTRDQRWIRGELASQVDQLRGLGEKQHLATELKSELAAHMFESVTETSTTILSSVDAINRQYGTNQPRRDTRKDGGRQYLEGTSDLPAIAQSLAHRLITTLGTGADADLRSIDDRMREVVQTSLTPPEEPKAEPPRRGLFGRYNR